MTKVFVNIGLSLDGYMVPEGTTLENWEKPEYKNWGAKWGALMGWIINQIDKALDGPAATHLRYVRD